MRFALLTALALAVALGLGGWSVSLSLDRLESAETVVVGPWHADRTAGAPDADPYSKARLSRSGDLVLGLGEGIAFQARVDTDGRTLLLQCDYRLDGALPSARVATFAAFDTAGRPIPPGAGRPGRLVSGTLLRDDGNAAPVFVGPLARAGNWLATTGSGPFVLALDLYDSPISTDSGAAPIAMPLIARTGCAGDG